ncbi:DUF484 family protein [Roseomonas sp. NAR14]|uniref:DUF484 family protein n=1 Tax=Roseomonas acroporae TaxID=2937791 RepID=A0A9X2BVX7_9PROT|nr:DUF484 family protein [Roseomonas acroporae]MCK8785501.1 DUF484 family protein [Roseomonas acroporae]
MSAAVQYAGQETDADAVAAWLRSNPNFLAERPELYRVLAPPRRVHGERVTDHMAAMLNAERQRVRALEAEMDSALATGRATAGLAIRVRLAVLALMRAQDVHEVVREEIPALLGLASCTLAAEPSRREAPERARPRLALLPESTVAWARPGFLPLPRGAVARLLGPGRDAVVRTRPEDLEMLHAEAASLVQRDALVRVPDSSGIPTLLVLGARDLVSLPPRQSTATLAFLGRAVAAALAR